MNLSSAVIPSVVKPPPVRPGDRVGVAAISGAVDPERLVQGLGALRALGFDPVVAENVELREGGHAGSDEARLRGLHDLAADPSLTAIFFARGGYGALRVLPQIDWELMARTPRAYVGYSDLTPFLQQVNLRLGIAAFHGPMIAGDFARGMTADEDESLLRALGGGPIRELELTGAHGTEAVTAPLVGGCLSLLTAVQGTPYAPEVDGAILFWEDVNEPLYRLDRMLTHLRLSGNLARIRGMVVGETVVSDAEEVGNDAFEAMLRSLSEEYGWPVGWGLPSGHGCPNMTLPLGLRATLDPLSQRLLFESEVSA